MPKPVFLPHRSQHSPRETWPPCTHGRTHFFWLHPAVYTDTQLRIGPFPDAKPVLQGTSRDRHPRICGHYNLTRSIPSEKDYTKCSPCKKNTGDKACCVHPAGTVDPR